MAEYCFEGAAFAILHYSPDGKLEGVSLSPSLHGAQISKRYHDKHHRPGGHTKIVSAEQLTELEEVSDESLGTVPNAR